MFELRKVLANNHKQINLIGSLMLTTALCIILVLVRLLYSNSPRYIWMLWNLFLALIPMGCSLIAFNMKKIRKRLSWLLLFGWSGIWLIFLPNSLYLVTDIIHLKPRNNVPLWYDLILLLSFAWAGSLLGLISISIMQSLVQETMGKIAGWIFTLMVLTASGFGIYIGRFLRWNSWDLILNPSRMATNLIEVSKHPWELAQALVFSGLIATLFTAIYLTLMAFIKFGEKTDLADF